LVVLENTHNRGGGKVLPLDNVKAISDIAHSNGLSVHMDGARIFNEVQWKRVILEWELNNAKSNSGNRTF